MDDKIDLSSTVNTKVKFIQINLQHAKASTALLSADLHKLHTVVSENGAKASSDYHSEPCN